MKSYNSPFTFQMREKNKRVLPRGESVLAVTSCKVPAPKKSHWQLNMCKYMYAFCKKHTIKKSKRSSFTLVEMIITIVFLGVFGALVFSSTSGAFLNLAGPELRIVNSSELQSAVETIFNTYQTGESGGVDLREDLVLFIDSTFTATGGNYTYSGTDFNITTRFIKVVDSGGNIIGAEVDPGDISNTPFEFIPDATSDNDLLQLTISHPDQAGMKIVLFLPQL